MSSLVKRSEAPEVPQTIEEFLAEHGNPTKEPREVGNLRVVDCEDGTPLIAINDNVYDAACENEELFVVRWSPKRGKHFIVELNNNSFDDDLAKV